MATAPRIPSSDLTDPEIERSKVFDPRVKKVERPVAISMSNEPARNPGDAIKRFLVEKSFGLGRRRKSRKLRRKVRKAKKTRKH